MPSELTLVKPVALPTQSPVAALYKSTNLADAFAIQLPLGTSADPDVLWRFLFLSSPLGSDGSPTSEMQSLRALV